MTLFIERLCGAIVDCDGGSGETRSLLGRAIADTLAVAAAGFSEPVTRKSLAAYAGAQSTIWSGERCESRDSAVFINAVAAHALDFDDVMLDSTIHASTVILPAILEMDFPAPPSELIASFGAGMVAARAIGRRVGNGHYHRGWHATGTYGAFVAAAAAARLHRLTRDQTAAALSLAGSQSGGMQRNFGTMAKPCHAGFAATAGLRAVRLAKAGVDAAADIFAGPTGFAALYGTGDGEENPDDDAFALRPDRVSVKLYPCCYAANRLIGVALDARTAVGSREGVKATLLVPAGSVAVLRDDNPKTALAAKFSAKYCVAVALADGPPTLVAFSDAALQRPGLAEMLHRVAVVEDADQQSGGDITFGTVRLDLHDRGGLIGRFERCAIPGSPDSPPDRGAVALKVADCLRQFEKKFPPLDLVRDDADIALWLSGQ
jgi:2-methylcitrate dehydratase PrpD